MIYTQFKQTRTHLHWFFKIDPWSPTGSTYYNLRFVHEDFDIEYLNENKVNFPENDDIAGYHHMGGTRVGHDPNNYDVVDKNLKLFGTNNLYLVGSSIFRTGGQANPTLTIVQLSLRLAEHLSSWKLKII